MTKIAVVFNPYRRGFSFWYQYLLLKQGLEAHGFDVVLFDTFVSRVKDFDVLLWWVPFRTPEFEDWNIYTKRFTKLQLFYNPLDTDSVSQFVIYRVKKFADAIITHSPENETIWRETKKDVILMDFAVSLEDIPEDCELNDDLYFVETRTFPIRRGTDIALSYDLKYHTVNKFFNSHKEFLREMCKAGNFIIPARGGEYEILALEALAMGMKVYYPERTAFSYIKDLPPTFPVRGKFCETEFRNDPYQTGCYYNVVRVKELPELKRPNAEYYKKSFTPEQITKPLVHYLEGVKL